jgi:hypothetical protein
MLLHRKPFSAIQQGLTFLPGGSYTAACEEGILDEVSEVSD